MSDPSASKISSMNDDVNADPNTNTNTNTDTYTSLCLVCVSTLQSPHLITSCGHTYCQTCLITHLQSLNICPTCHTIITHVSNQQLLILDHSIPHLHLKWNGIEYKLVLHGDTTKPTLLDQTIRTCIQHVLHVESKGAKLLYRGRVLIPSMLHELLTSSPHATLSLIGTRITMQQAFTNVEPDTTWFGVIKRVPSFVKLNGLTAFHYLIHVDNLVKIGWTSVDIIWLFLESLWHPHPPRTSQQDNNTSASRSSSSSSSSSSSQQRPQQPRRRPPGVDDQGVDPMLFGGG